MPFGVRGKAITYLFLIWMRRIALLERALCNLRRAEARCASVVRTPVVLKARCASVVRTPVVLKARLGRRDSRGAWFHSRLVMPGVIPAARDPDRTPGVPAWCCGGVVGACGRQPERARPERRTCRFSRPLRARDHRVFENVSGCARGG